MIAQRDFCIGNEVTLSNQKSQILLARSVIVTALSFITLGNGCATNSVDLIKDGAVRTKVIPPHGLYIPRVSVTADQSTTHISGILRWLPQFDGPSMHDLSVEIADPNGAILYRGTAMLSPQSVPTKSDRQSHFFCRVPFVVPTESVITVSP